MRGLIIILSGLGIVFGIGNFAHPSDAMAQGVTLKFSMSGPPQNYLTRRLSQWTNDVNAEGGSALKVQFIPGLADGRNDYDIIRNAVSDIGLVLHGSAQGKFPRTDVAQLPFLFVNSAVGSWALQNISKQGLLTAEYDEVRPMGLFTFPGSALHTKKSVTRLEDFSGLKVRIGGNIFAQTVKELGAAGTYVPYPDVFSALDKGIVDGVVMAYSGVGAIRLDRILRYSLDVGLGATTAMICMNPSIWNKLSADSKQILAKNSGDAMTEIAATANVNEENRNRDNLLKNENYRVQQLSAAETARWEQKVKSVYDAWASATPDGRKVLDAFRAEVKAQQAKLGAM